MRGVESYEISPERFDAIQNLREDIKLLLENGGKYTPDDLFNKFLLDPHFPSQPVSNEREKRQNFELAISGLNAEEYFINETLIYKKNVNKES